MDHRLGVDAWREAEYRLDADRVARGWIFAPRQFLRYPQASPDAPRDDPVKLDLQRGDVVLDRALFREMRREGRWPLVLSLERKELANLVAPGGVIARRLGLKAPASGDRVLHLVPYPLDACRLGRDGIETPAVDGLVLAAPRLAREERERRFARIQQQLEEVPGSAGLPADLEPMTVPTVKPQERRPVSTRVRAAVVADSTTTLATLLRELDMFEPPQEHELKAQLYSLLDEGVIEFDEPLGRWAAIRTTRS
ncbi:MAG: hypothetical protein ACRDNK_01650 [Solirubrobacteraceae bacterium]